MTEKYHKLKVDMYDKKITQKELATAIGMSEQTLNSKLNGRRSFSVDEAEKISKYLGINTPTEYFFNSMFRGA